MRYVLTNDKFNSTLEKFVEDSMIMEFESFDEIKDFINLNCPDIEEKIESVKDLERVLGEYYFNYNGRFYDIMFDEALEIRDYLPKGYFELPCKIKNADSYEKFEAYFEGRIEGQTETYIGKLLKEICEKVKVENWVVFTKDIKDKNDLQIFSDDYFGEGEREDFVEELSEYLEKEINIDDPKTWLPFLKAKTSCIENAPHLVIIKDDWDDTLYRLYDDIEIYNELVENTKKVIEAYKNLYKLDVMDSLKIAFTIGKIYDVKEAYHTQYDQKRLYDMVIESWKEFDGFNYDLED